MAKKVIGRKSAWIYESKIIPINLLQYEMTGLVDEGTPVDVYPDVSKVFNTLSHKILVDELMKNGLDKWTVRWIEKWQELPSSQGCH